MLQKMFGTHRRKFNFRSRTKKKRRNKHVETIIRHEADGSETPIELEMDEYPFHTWALPIYDVPGLTWPEPIETVKSGDRLASFIGEIDAKTMLGAGGGSRPVSFRLPYHPHKFMRFLAKMAHGYAVATLGQNSFNPLLPDLILGRVDEPRILVGGILEQEAPRPHVFEISLGFLERCDGKEFLCARIRLLAYLGAPTYTVVIGDGFREVLSTIEHCAYAKPIKVSVTRRDGTPIL